MHSEPAVLVNIAVNTAKLHDEACVSLHDMMLRLKLGPH